MTDETRLREALEAADAVISRLQEKAADHLSQKDALDEARAFYDLVEILETSRDISKVRMALERDPFRFGEPTPVSRAGHTG